MALKLSPIGITDAGRYVGRWHRHNDVPAGGIVAQCTLNADGWVCGVAIIGRPVSRILQERGLTEVIRVSTDGTRNACSMLLGWAARWARVNSPAGIVTYTRADEPGTSLRAAGWIEVARTKKRKAGGWNNRPGRASHEAIQKIRWMPKR
jgi:hypothetical protein